MITSADASPCDTADTATKSDIATHFAALQLSHLEAALAQTLRQEAHPPQLAQAMRYAVFSGGARLRPQLCLAVHAACNGQRPNLALGAAAAIELLHCASLVHDDLPCFDNAKARRGKPAVHCRYGESLAVLVGDGLIVAAFAALHVCNDFDLKVHAAISRAASALVCGQGWESEPAIDLQAYHAAKTGALFVAATTCGALAAGDTPSRWRPLGSALGEAYQLADDIADLAEDQHASNPQPNAAAQTGVTAARRRLQGLLDAAHRAVPELTTDDGQPSGINLDRWFTTLRQRMDVG
jgi:geranylgeranyl diphosphate synthase type II